MEFGTELDSLLIKLELKAWFKYGIIFTLVSLFNNTFFPDSTDSKDFPGLFTIVLLYYIAVSHIYFDGLGSEMRVEIGKRHPVPLNLRVGPRIQMQRNLIDVFTRVMLYLGLLWVSRDFERISRTLCGRYSPKIEPYLGIFLSNADYYTGMGLFMDFLVFFLYAIRETLRALDLLPHNQPPRQPRFLNLQDPEVVLYLDLLRFLYLLD